MDNVIVVEEPVISTYVEDDVAAEAISTLTLSIWVSPTLELLEDELTPDKLVELLLELVTPNSVELVSLTAVELLDDGKLTDDVSDNIVELELDELELLTEVELVDKLTVELEEELSL